MAEMDRVWKRLRDRANLNADHDLLISMSDARRLVSNIYLDEWGERPRAETTEFLAGELVRLTLEARGTGKPPAYSRDPERFVC
jgi:hypothetical protein